MSEVIEGYAVMRDSYYWRHGHTWAKLEDGMARIGMTSLGAVMAGDIILVRFKPVGTPVEQGKPICTIESAKWVGPVESPLSGDMVEVNQLARKSPRIIRKDPYGQGWLALLRPSGIEADRANVVTGDEALEWFKAEVRNWREKKKD
jgi:glycine cleavage system H protein